MNAAQVSRALAWFGIGLGVVEVLAPREVAKAAGLEGCAGTIRLFGVREIASGVIILAARDPVEWLWVRVLGDALDAVLLSSAMRPSNPGSARALAATAAVAPVVALDAIYAARRRR